MQPNLLIINLLCVCPPIYAGSEAKEIPVEIRFIEHHFVPSKLVVPANQPLLLTVVNSSRERIEFESFKLNREKVVEPGSAIVVHLPALSAGSYDFFDDFHGDVPEGEIISKPANEGPKQ
jgi:hypothetical protein